MQKLHQWCQVQWAASNDAGTFRDQYRNHHCLISSLTTWMMGQDTLLVSLHTTPDEGTAAIHRDVDRLEKWVDKA